jgi:phosphate transport system substrate-binding protein
MVFLRSYHPPNNGSMKLLRLLAPWILAAVMPTTLLWAVPGKRVSIKGSDTMVILVQKWTELYPDNSMEFQVTGGGSGTGLAAIINGTTDICSSSRPIKKDEVKQLMAKYKYRGCEVRVARDGLAVYVHKSNRVQELTLEQIRKIFTGEITNWKAVGGADKRIVLYSRENNSGTYEFFKEHVLQKQDFAATAQHMAGTAALINAVGKDPSAIGFGGAAYASNVKAIAVAKNAQSGFVRPNKESILDGTYPISRFLYFYLHERPTGEIKKFIDWVISPSGQKIVEDVGYYPIKKF